MGKTFEVQVHGDEDFAVYISDLMDIMGVDHRLSAYKKDKTYWVYTATMGLLNRVNKNIEVGLIPMRICYKENGNLEIKQNFTGGENLVKEALK